jgi:glutathione synthase
MDPIEHVNIDGDTTFAMAEEAQSRGHSLFVYQVDTLAWREGKVTAHAKPVTVRRLKGDHVTFGEPITLDLAEDVDVVLMRQDPPFDMAYVTAAHMLEFIMDKTLVVNNPFWVRSSPEKIVPLLFPDLMPPTLVTRDRTEIESLSNRSLVMRGQRCFGSSLMMAIWAHCSTSFSPPAANP